MEFGLETLAQVIVFVVAFAATVVFLSDTDDGADRLSIMCGLRTLAKMIAGRMERPVQMPRREGRLSEETYRRLLYVHMTNAAPDQRIWFR